MVGDAGLDEDDDECIAYEYDPDAVYDEDDSEDEDIEVEEDVVEPQARVGPKRTRAKPIRSSRIDLTGFKQINIGREVVDDPELSPDEVHESLEVWNSHVLRSIKEHKAYAAGDAPWDHKSIMTGSWRRWLNSKTELEIFLIVDGGVSETRRILLGGALMRGGLTLADMRALAGPSVKEVDGWAVHMNMIQTSGGLFLYVGSATSANGAWPRTLGYEHGVQSARAGEYDNREEPNSRHLKILYQPDAQASLRFVATFIKADTPKSHVLATEGILTDIFQTIAKDAQCTRHTPAMDVAFRKRGLQQASYKGLNSCHQFKQGCGEDTFSQVAKLVDLQMGICPVCRKEKKRWLLTHVLEEEYPGQVICSNCNTSSYRRLGKMPREHWSVNVSDRYEKAEQRRKNHGTHCSICRKAYEQLTGRFIWRNPLSGVERTANWKFADATPEEFACNACVGMWRYNVTLEHQESPDVWKARRRSEQAAGITMYQKADRKRAILDANGWKCPYCRNQAAEGERSVGRWAQSPLSLEEGKLICNRCMDCWRDLVRGTAWNPSEAEFKEYRDPVVDGSVWRSDLLPSARGGVGSTEGQLWKAARLEYQRRTCPVCQRVIEDAKYWRPARSGESCFWCKACHASFSTEESKFGPGFNVAKWRRRRASTYL